MMKRFFLYLALLGATLTELYAQDTLFVKETAIPVMKERRDNILYYMRIDAKETKVLQHVKLTFAKGTQLSAIKSVRLYYGGTEARQEYEKKRMAPVEYVSFMTPEYTRRANPSYSILKAEADVRKNTVKLETTQKLFPGVNFFWIGIELDETASLDDTFRVRLDEVKADKRNLPLSFLSTSDIEHRTAVGVRYAGDDGSKAFRIPGLTTTRKGTLLGVYDVRYNNSVDLQEHVDVGLSRSMDGGRTWEEMRLPLSFGNEGGLPSAQNGVGDPSILVDEKNNTVWVIALWTHGMGNQRAWWSSQPGMDKSHTGQLVLTKSTDDGVTWSAPINITEMVKRPEWYLLLQGPGRGITMKDGTLVFPIQFIDKDRMPHAGIMYSKNRGKTWTIHEPARSNTTEAQVAEIEPGVLMLNMRDNRGGSRAVSITKDLGRTWTEHASSRSALIEPVCMGSLLHIQAKKNVLKRDLLLFSNPNSTKERKNMTIKVSLDGGLTWEKENSLCLDEGQSWGYSCLTQIDEETIGILYEGSTAHMVFQRIKIKDLVKKH